ncbi:phospholipase D-like domain-containing protein [Mesorhizobium sp. WSM3859]|uniref:phospholipase D-like domain-containing protein n=1 Tax=Mesorhizobium sp. WSM3859 TaxID=2029402 RepID=UPI0015968B0F|nr:phospholipase D-like domain-containing protein [Mesorhizobium sp. WSM3859]
MGRKLRLQVPKGFETVRALVSILASDLTVKRSTTLKEAAGGIVLDPGVYAARAVLADGRVLQAAFQLDKGRKEAVVELAAMPARQPLAAAGSSLQRGEESDVRQVDTVLESAVLNQLARPFDVPTLEVPTDLISPLEPPLLSLATLDLDGNTVGAEFPLVADSAGKAVVSRDASPRFVRARYPAGELLVAAPTSSSESATLVLTPGSPREVHIDLEDDDADLLLAYLDGRRVEQLSQLVEGYWERSRELLEHKYEHPVAAAIGAYVMVLVGSPHLSEADCLSSGNWLDRWTSNLFYDFPWLVDGLCIRGEILARRGEHEEAVELFCQMPGRGLPMFTFGFRFALDRLSGYRNAAAKGLLAKDHLTRIDVVLKRLQRLAVTVDFRRPVLSSWRPSPVTGQAEMGTPTAGDPPSQDVPRRTVSGPTVKELQPRSSATVGLAGINAASPEVRETSMTEAFERERRRNARASRNEEFVQRLLARHSEASARYRGMLQSASAVEESVLDEMDSDAAGPSAAGREAVLETIVRKERPVLFVSNDWLDVVNVTTFGVEAEELVRDLNARRTTLQPLMPLVGRIDVTSFPGADFVGTGWFVDSNIVVTNRHVAELIAHRDGRRYAFTRGVGGTIAASLNTLHEFDDLAVDAARAFAVEEVLYIERDPAIDIAFLRVRRRTDGARPDRIAISAADAVPDSSVVTVGYPARASKRIIPDQQLMEDLYRGRYDVKRAAPGLALPRDGASWRHDCTTLGGASGSPVLDPTTGMAVGLHFAGLYEEANFAVPASILRDYVSKKRWTTPPPEIETSSPPKPQMAAKTQAAVGATSALSAGVVSITIPLTISVSLGQPAAGTNTTAAVATVGNSATEAEAAVKAFWAARPDGVIAARIGFGSVAGAIGDQPYIAAAAPADKLAEVTRRGPASFAGYEVRYQPANATEMIDGLALAESVDSISYDDDARTGPAFSFDQVNEEMTVRAHVGPEYSWDELKAFLSGDSSELVSAIYEFHAPQIKDAIEVRLDSGAALTLVCDNVTYAPVKNPREEFDRDRVFNDWNNRFHGHFQRVVPPEGRAGLISDAYHIKVTVKDDESFWLSSGNWKAGSSQPVITQAQRDDAARVDLPGNREWHVVIENAKLAGRFRSHILQDFHRSQDLGGGERPRQREASDILVDVALDQQILEERPPPSRLLEPRTFSGRIRTKPLLTPDQEGAVYSEAVLELIRSARQSLHFQIPYIAMPSNPNADRGFIDRLIEALTDKLLSLPDAKVILRSGGSKFSAPTHAAWFFKSKGVDIENRLKQIENHHTKGMVVDGKQVLIGSHNWSKPGVTLNRDASLIFADPDIANYFEEAFDIDWQRASRIRPREFSRESIRGAVSDAPPQGFMRIPLSELLKDED